MNNLYFANNYGKLYEKVEGGECKVFNFQHSVGEVRHVFIKRRIPVKLNEKTYFDIVTPGAYGGPIILKCLDSRETELVNEFQRAFANYSAANRIVSEVAHFHPALFNANDFNGIYDVTKVGNTLGTKLSSSNPLEEEFSESFKKTVFLSLANGVNFRVSAGPYNTRYFKELFLSLIYENDQRDEMVNEEYVSSCFDMPRNNTVIVEVSYNRKTIGISLNLLFNNVLQTQLSTALKSFDYLAPKHILHYGLADWGKKNGAKIIHNGAGRTIGEEDDLYFYKQHCGSLKFEYYVGKKIWNAKAYEELCSRTGVGINASYFPAYCIKDQLLAEERPVKS